MRASNPLNRPPTRGWGGLIPPCSFPYLLRTEELNHLFLIAYHLLVQIHRLNKKLDLFEHEEDDKSKKCQANQLWGIP